VSDQDNKPWEWGDKGVPQNPINHYPEGTRFLCCGYDGHMNQFSQGNWVRHEDYAKLQMERIHDLNQMGGLCEENARLKAEVERLRFAEDLLKDENQHLHKEQPLPDGWNSAVAKACDLLAEKEKENARLKAEVERLTSDIQMEKENEDRLVREWQKANNEVYGLKTQVAALIDDQTRLKAECQARQAENSVLAVECDSLKAEVERLTLLQVETLDERNRAEADVKALRVELADAQESYHLVNERIAQILKQRAQP